MTTSSPPPLALRPRSARSSCRAWPKRPVQERFAVIDTTTERLTVESGTSPRGLVVVRGERDGWFAGHAKDTGKTGGTDVPNWLSVYEARPVHAADGRQPEDDSAGRDRPQVHRGHLPARRGPARREDRPVAAPA